MQGIFLREERRMEQSALWVSYLLTAQTGEQITPDMLLLPAEEVQAAKEAEAEAKITALQERVKNATQQSLTYEGVYEGPQ